MLVFDPPLLQVHCCGQHGTIQYAHSTVIRRSSLLFFGDCARPTGAAWPALAVRIPRVCLSRVVHLCQNVHFLRCIVAGASGESGFSLLHNYGWVLH